MPKKIDLTGKRFERLTVLEQAETISGRITWLCDCDCGNQVTVKGIYLTTSQTKSCGCLKKDMDEENLRNKYNASRIDGVMKPLFKGKEPRSDSAIGYRGVYKYYTPSKILRYRAWITVNGKRYYKSGFKTPEDAYYNGRLALEKEHLKFKNDKK